MTDQNESERQSLLPETQDATKDEGEEMEGSTSRHQPPREGGWGWVVVAAAFMVVCVLDGVGYSFGVFLLPLLDDNMDGGDGRGLLSMAGSLQVGCYGLSSPFVAVLVNRYGARVCCMSGAVLSAIGLIVASFATGIKSLIGGYSVITGLGFGLMYLPACVIPSQHFTVRRSLATGLVLCAAGVGTFLVAPLAQIMLDQWGWRGAMRGLSVLCLSCVLCGAAMTRGEHGKNEPANDRTEPCPPSSSRGFLAKLLGAGLATSPLLPVFFLVALADALASCSLYIPFTHLPSAAENSGLSPEEGAMLVSIIGLTNTFGRVLAGWVADQPWLRPLYMTTLVVCCASSILFVFAVCTLMWHYAVLAALFGLFTGMWVSVAPATLIDLLGVTLLAQAFGFLTFFRGIAALSGPPIAGLAVDRSGSPAVALLVAGGIMTGATLTYMVTVGVFRRIERSLMRSGYEQIG